MTDNVYTCVICGHRFKGFGNNPYPVRKSGRCCDVCNDLYVLPARVKALNERKEASNGNA